MADSVDGAVLIRLTLGSETLCPRRRLACPSYSPLSAAVKEALWHAVTACVRADVPVAHAFQAGTGITWPCQVWYLTAREALLRLTYLSTKSRECLRRSFPRAGRTK